MKGTSHLVARSVFVGLFAVVSLTAGTRTADAHGSVDQQQTAYDFGYGGAGNPFTAIWGQTFTPTVDNIVAFEAGFYGVGPLTIVIREWPSGPDLVTLTVTIPHAFFHVDLPDGGVALTPGTTYGILVVGGGEISGVATSYDSYSGGNLVYGGDVPSQDFPFVTFYNPDFATDRDFDGVHIPADNCPDAANPEQTDTDGDGQGDACEPDDDEDGVPDVTDNCVQEPNPDQTDNEEDGLGDACDLDDDNDGFGDGQEIEFGSDPFDAGSTPPYSEDRVDQSFVGFTHGPCSHAGYLGQTFTTGPTVTGLSAFDIWFAFGTGAGAIFSISELSNPGNVLATAGPADVAGFYHFVLPSVLPVSPSTKYVIFQTGGPDVCFQAWLTAFGDIYTRGHIWSGYEDASWDASFQTYERVAIPPPCGNGVVDAGEDCDDGSTIDGDCCSSDCQIEPASNVCRPAAGPCDVEETCTGTSGSCPLDGMQAAGTGCDDDSNPCTADACDGSSPACQHPAGNTGATCRASTGECDPAETCDGTSDSCPANGFASAGTPCTSDGDVCTDDGCDGLGACAHPDNTAPCDDGDTCTTGDSCGSGTCVGALLVPCTFVADTPPGSNVTSQSTVGTSTVALTFGGVTAGGTTSVTSIDPASAGTLPGGYTISGANLAFEISTTASFNTPITACFQVPSVTDPVVFASLRILHAVGKPDLAVANSGSNNASVRLGNGSGGFDATTNFTVGTNPVSVAVADFNGDGKRDLATANQNSNNVSIRLGDGAGGFGANTNFSVGIGPRSVAVGDFNADGWRDLAVANASPNNVSIRLGNGAGGFGPATSVAVGTSPRSVAVGDFDADGSLDFATANQASNNVSIRLGNGTGGFGPVASFAVGANPVSVAVGDFNGDDRLDFATANQGGNSVSIRLADAAGGFGPVANLAVATSPVSIALGDFNVDGRLDFATANQSANNVTVRLGDGAGGFGPATNLPVGTTPRAVALGDFNADGKLDFATANQGSNNATIRLGNGDGTFGAATNFPLGTGPAALAVVNLNGDTVLVDQTILTGPLAPDFATRTICASTLSLSPFVFAEAVPPALSALTLAPATVVGGSSSTATVTLSAPAPIGGALVTLADDSPVVTVPPSVAVPPGATSATFTVQTGAVTSTTSATIFATFDDVTLTAVLTVTPPAGGSLPAPSLLSPPNGAEILPWRTITFDWSNVTGAASYTIQIDDAQTFLTPVAQRTTTPSQYATGGLPTRRMWWRVRANDASGRPGAWSALRWFEVDY